MARDPRRDEPPPPSGDWGTAYPFPVATKDGKVLLRTGQGRGRNFLLLVDPAWVQETFQATNFSSGIDDWSTFATKGVELLSHPDKSGAKALSVRKTSSDWPATAVWNFPMSSKGRLRLRLKLKSGFQGAIVGLTDHYSPPFDYEDNFFNIYNFTIGPNGQLANGQKLEPERWHTVTFDWDHAKREIRVSTNRRVLAVLPMLRESSGVNYLRLRSTAATVDLSGFLVDSVEADVSEGWSKSLQSKR